MHLLNRTSLACALALSIGLTGCSKSGETETAAAPQAAAPAAAPVPLKVFGGRLSDPNDPMLTGFTEATGYPVELVTGVQPQQIIQALEAGEAPADVFMLVDSTTIQSFIDRGNLQPIQSTYLEERVPEYLRDLENGWVGYATRARIIYVNPQNVTNPPARYEDLSNPAYRGMICVGPAASAYNTSIMASMIEHLGEEAALNWAQGVVANFARPAAGRDAELLAEVASGETCQITIANHYYYLRMKLSGDPTQIDVTQGVQPIFPNQEPGDRGAYQNVMTFALVKGSQNTEVAHAFLEYLLSDKNQQYVAQGIFYPAVAAIQPVNAETEFGVHKRDTTPFRNLGLNAAKARELLQQAGWQ